MAGGYRQQPQARPYSGCPAGGWPRSFPPRSRRCRRSPCRYRQGTGLTGRGPSPCLPARSANVCTKRKRETSKKRPTKEEKEELCEERRPADLKLGRDHFQVPLDVRRRRSCRLAHGFNAAALHLGHHAGGHHHSGNHCKIQGNARA